MSFEPNYKHFLSVMRNERPARLPLYEHLVNPPIIEKILNQPLSALLSGDEADQGEYLRRYCAFFRQMQYDIVTYEVCIGEVLPEGGALSSEQPGPIQTRADFERYPWESLVERFFTAAAPRFDRLRAALPAGMKGIGGVGNGVFEIAQDLVGYVQLCYMQSDDPELFSDLFKRIGQLVRDVWARFLPLYGDLFVVCRIGDDMGFKTQTLLSPRTIRKHIIPEYQQIIAQIHDARKPFLLHSCGNIFPVMDDLIAAGIDGKHSHEDVIAPFSEWIERYADRIALFGGIDVDFLCRHDEQTVYQYVLEHSKRYREQTRGYAFGSGNSIPEYVPVENYLAMVRAVQNMRNQE